jgi:hypothetical protein
MKNAMPEIISLAEEVVVLDKLTSQDFSPHLNQKFRLCGDASGPLEAELIEVTDLPGDPADLKGGTRRQPFSIVLVGPAEPVLQQSIYRIEHEKLGPLDLFLVPIGPNDKGMRYEAVFA